MKNFHSFGFTAKTWDDENYTVEAIVSTASPDRDGEVILPSAFAARLDEYKRNPILAWGHPLSAMCDSPGPDKIIGRADAIEIREEGLWCKFRYAVGENETAALCWRMMRGGFLNAFSIGAMGVDYVDSNSPPEKRATLPLDMREALASGEIRRVWTEMELVEVSHVFVGSNRDALVSAALAGDDQAVELLAKSSNQGDIMHRAAVLVRSIKADQLKMLDRLDAIQKRLDEPVAIILDAGDATEEVLRETAEIDNSALVAPFLVQAGPAILAACRYLTEE